MINIHGIKSFFYIFFASFLLFVFISCESTDTPATPKPVETPKESDTKPIEKIEQPDNIKVSDAVYKETFTNVEAFIEMLNKIIGDSNFDEWRRHLTRDYIDFYSNLSNLRVVSQEPALKRHNIVLTSLRDYFVYVIAPSRADVRLDSISFIDDNNIRAYMIIDGEPWLLYNLVRFNETWRIDK